LPGSAAAAVAAAGGALVVARVDIGTAYWPDETSRPPLLPGGATPPAKEPYKGCCRCSCCCCYCCG